jgi:hypothetical protein
MLSGHGAARLAVSALGRGEYTFGKARRAGNGLAHAANFDDVNSN